MTEPHQTVVQFRLISSEGSPEQSAAIAGAPLPIDETAPPPHSPDMNERIARLEGAADGHKQSQTILAAAVGIVSAVLVGGMAIVVTLQIFNDQRASSRIDGLEKKVDELPEKIGASIRDANRAFSEALTAAVATQGQRQSAPIIIQVPAAPEQAKPAP